MRQGQEIYIHFHFKPVVGGGFDSWSCICITLIIIVIKHKHPGCRSKSPSTKLPVVSPCGLYLWKPGDSAIFPSKMCSFLATSELSQKTFNCRTSDLPHLSFFIANFPLLRSLVYPNEMSSEVFFFSTVGLRRTINEVLRKECTLRKSPLSWLCPWTSVLFAVLYLPSTQSVSGDS